MKITLNCGNEMLIDEQDLHLCTNLQFRKNQVYKRWRENGKFKSRALHRVIMNCPKGLEVDHIDLNVLNNQRSNLRIVTRSQNAMNRNPQKKQKKYSHPYRGISFHPKQRGEKRWSARIKVCGKSHALGYYHTAFDAAMAYDAAVEKYHGEYGRKNFNKD